MKSTRPCLSLYGTSLCLKYDRIQGASTFVYFRQKKPPQVSLVKGHNVASLQ